MGVRLAIDKHYIARPQLDICIDVGIHIVLSHRVSLCAE